MARAAQIAGGVLLLMVACALWESEYLRVQFSELYCPCIIGTIGMGLSLLFFRGMGPEDLFYGEGQRKRGGGRNSTM
jgi:hypothetical protein